MFNFKKSENGLSMENNNQMKDAYEGMGILNISLSEEGLEQDRKDLESYEKYLVESE